ncbi:MAG: hypothetical protein QGF92_05170, partial [Gammaproteobacteria bacterium]|nr:hypothetical protein [Gammaproteobacteria bacterium]
MASRKLNPFNLSFLDIMSCGFGAAILLFLIVKHNAEANLPVTDTMQNLTAEADVVVIGTGAGGGTTAEILARSGLSVILVEEGRLYYQK